jgi:hypothetical protein
MMTPVKVLRSPQLLYIKYSGIIIEIAGIANPITMILNQKFLYRNCNFENPKAENVAITIVKTIVTTLI